MNYFAIALSKGMRFPSVNGLLSLEQVFSIKLDPADPNNKLRKMVEEAYEEYKPETKTGLEFLKPIQTAKITDVEIRFEVLKEVYNFKLAEIEAASKKADIKKQIAFLEEQLLKKQQAETEKSFEGQSSADIMKQINALKASM